METVKNYGAFGLAAVLLAAGFLLPDGYGLIAWLAAALAACAGFIQSDHRFGALSTALLLAGSNGYLLSRKFASAGDSICNISAKLNCDLVNNSAASEMFGIPITLLGLGFYAGLAIAALLANKESVSFDRINAGFAMVSLVYSAYLGFQTYLIGATCVVCITIYIGNALLLWSGMRGLNLAGETLTQDAAQALTSNHFLIIVGTFAIVVLFGRNSWTTRTGAEALPDINSPEAHTPDVLGKLMATPSGPVELDGSEPILGAAGARYQVVEWADFGCPHCARASVELHQIVEEHPDVSVKFKVFPLTGDCNPVLQPGGGPERCNAAFAAECARQQGKFWEMSHQLFVNQGYFKDDDVRFIARQIKLDPDAFEACMVDPATRAGVVADAVAGAKAGVRGTPSLYMKGTHGDRWVEMAAGPASILRLVEAHKDGVSLPEPGPPVDH